MPSFFIRLRSVLGWRARIFAAPCGPSMTQSDFSRQPECGSACWIPGFRAAESVGMHRPRSAVVFAELGPSPSRLSGWTIRRCRGEHFRVNLQRRAVRQDDRPFQNVFQLANVSRPRVAGSVAPSSSFRPTQFARRCGPRTWPPECARAAARRPLRSRSGGRVIGKTFRR